MALDFDALDYGRNKSRHAALDYATLAGSPAKSRNKELI